MKFNFNKLEKIGEGSEKEVYSHPSDGDKVVARFKERKENISETSQQIKGRYYLTKILHSVYPTSIPDVHLVAKGEETILISERKNLDDSHKEHNDLRMQIQNDDSADLQDKYLEVRDSRDEKLVWDDNYIDLIFNISSLGVRTDPSPSNFGYDRDNNLVFIDNNFTPWFIKGNEIVKNYDVEKILEVAGKVDEKERENIKNYLERLEDLFNEDKNSLNL